MFTISRVQLGDNRCPSLICTVIKGSRIKPMKSIQIILKNIAKLPKMHIYTQRNTDCCIHDATINIPPECRVIILFNCWQTNKLKVESFSSRCEAVDPVNPVPQVCFNFTFQSCVKLMFNKTQVSWFPFLVHIVCIYMWPNNSPNPIIFQLLSKLTICFHIQTMKPEIKPKRSEVEHLLQSVLVPAYPPNRSFIPGKNIYQLFWECFVGKQEAIL